MIAREPQHHAFPPALDRDDACPSVPVQCLDALPDNIGTTNPAILQDRAKHAAAKLAHHDFGLWQFRHGFSFVVRISSLLSLGPCPVRSVWSVNGLNRLNGPNSSVYFTSHASRPVRFSSLAIKRRNVRATASSNARMEGYCFKIATWLRGEGCGNGSTSVFHMHLDADERSPACPVREEDSTGPAACSIARVTDSAAALPNVTMAEGRRTWSSRSR